MQFMIPFRVLFGHFHGSEITKPQDMADYDSIVYTKVRKLEEI